MNEIVHASKSACSCTRTEKGVKVSGDQDEKANVKCVQVISFKPFADWIAAHVDAHSHVQRLEQCLSLQMSLNSGLLLLGTEQVTFILLRLKVRG